MELVFQSFKYNKDSSKLESSWFEELKNLITLALHDESFMLLNETQFVKKQLKEVSHGKILQKGLSIFFNKKATCTLTFFFVFHKEIKRYKNQVRLKL